MSLSVSCYCGYLLVCYFSWWWQCWLSQRFTWGQRSTVKVRTAHLIYASMLFWTGKRPRVNSLGKNGFLNLCTPICSNLGSGQRSTVKVRTSYLTCVRRNILPREKITVSSHGKNVSRNSCTPKYFIPWKRSRSAATVRTSHVTCVRQSILTWLSKPQ